ncbi:cytochrome P450 736A117-like [Argentina anserina]|uniref:cytochrome P450 736A117-like n=1 Tax=Argentina anserina TaxID=57926 RepID=UPI00217681AF|nr:cytochrome P450 736A117-like [Potentilla anserina]
MEQPPPAITISTLLTVVFPFTFFTIFLLRWLLPATPPTQKCLPPSPFRLPIIGNLHQLGRLPHRSLYLLAHRLGPMMLLHLGVRPVLIVSSADDALDVMKTHDLVFSNRPRFTASEKLLYHGKSVASSTYGEHWSSIRNVCVVQLLSADKVKSFLAEREEELGVLVEEVKQLASVGLPVNLSEMFCSFCVYVICRAALGRKYGGAKFREMIGEFMRLLGGFYMRDFVPWLAWVDWINGSDAKIERVAREFDGFLDNVIDEHVKGESGDRSVEGGKDFVDVLLEVQSSGSDGTAIDRDSIKGIILDMFSGGTDTTYTVLEWAMTEILIHSRVCRKLQNEALEIANGKPDISESDLDNMHYLKAVIKETLRLHPPIPLLSPRESTEDVKIMDHDIEAKTMVCINAWAIGRDPAEWDEPEEFRPERFMNSAVDFKGHHFQLLPFGAGRRGCPGILFAMTTIELVLANIVHKFDWELPAGTTAENINMTECSGVVAHRKTPLVAVAKLRSF